MKLTENHIKLFKSISARGKGRICNDLEPQEEALLTKDEWKEFCKNYHHWNGDPEIFEERTSYHMMDFMILDYITYLLTEIHRGKI